MTEAVVVGESLSYLLRADMTRLDQACPMSSSPAGTWSAAAGAAGDDYSVAGAAGASAAGSLLCRRVRSAISSV